VNSGKQKASFIPIWQKKISTYNTADALRKLKQAHRYLEMAKSKEIEKNDRLLCSVTLKMSEDMISHNQENEAINHLKNSLEYANCANIHHKLASIFLKQSQLDKAIYHTDQVYKLDNTEENANIYRSLLIQAAKKFQEQGDFKKAKWYFYKSRNIASSQPVLYQGNNKILLNVLRTNFSHDKNKNGIIPSIEFNIINLNTKPIDYLKTKVIFIYDNQKISEVAKVIVDEKEPILPDNKTLPIGILADRSIEDFNTDKNMRIEIYLSDTTPDKWVLYRNTFVDLK